MSIGIWELALILLFLVVAACAVALITRFTRSNDEHQHTIDNPKNHSHRP